MPLIRLVSHPTGNKFYVDKMIRIEGLPDKFLFYKLNGKNFLKAPWEIDVTDNIPEHIRFVHQPKPFIVNVHNAPIEKGQPPMDEEREAYGISLDYQNGAGEDMWQQIERILDQNTPRGERVPVPIVVAPDIDNDHRNKDFSIKADEIPVVFLSGFNEKKETPASPVIKEAVKVACPDCGKEFKSAQAVRMHKMKVHPKVAAGV